MGGLVDLEQDTTSGPISLDEEIRADFVADLELESSKPRFETVDDLASNIEDDSLLALYITV
jgi:hypothetical protein